MNSIQAVMRQSRVANAPHPVFAIDGQSLEVWLKSACPKFDTLGLVPAQGWLIDDEEFQWSWERISCVEPGTSTIVPVLVCGDDVDLTCTVVVAEQEATAQLVIWRRMGLSRSGGREVGITTEWFPGTTRLEFQREEFLQALEEFKRLAVSV